jgi:excisionase family DNA binding protein
MLKKDIKDDISPPRMLTVSEVAHLLHVHANTIRMWSKIGVIKSYRIGKRRDYRFRAEDVETFLHKDAASPEEGDSPK